VEHSNITKQFRQLKAKWFLFGFSIGLLTGAVAMNTRWQKRVDAILVEHKAAMRAEVAASKKETDLLFNTLRNLCEGDNLKEFRDGIQSH
jgi:hypothetical protein